jgi:formamidopyrimidine-DNA glycosylase
MPELPEVETIKLELNQLIVGKKITSVDINLAKQVKMPACRFFSIVEGAKISKVRRRAKVIIIDLVKKYHIVIHLKMTGQLIFKKKNKLAGGGHPIFHDIKKLPNKYSHVIFNFSDNSRLFFNDTRQFGWVKLFNSKQMEEFEDEFGPEPLEISLEDFKKLFEKNKSVIKPLLMNPSFIAGVGNIYAAEALFMSQILPTRKSDSLNDNELKRLYQSLRKILKLAIKMKGTTASDYVDAFGRAGSMEKYLRVYGREGKPCKRCKNRLVSIKQGSRATVFCNSCQK